MLNMALFILKENTGETIAWRPNRHNKVEVYILQSVKLLKVS